jgi:hypothetical protein
VWVIATVSIADPTPLALPGLSAPATLADVLSGVAHALDEHEVVGSHAPPIGRPPGGHEEGPGRRRRGPRSRGSLRQTPQTGHGLEPARL